VNGWIKSIQSRVVAGLMPPICVLCGEAGVCTSIGVKDLCLACRKSLPWAGSQCARCALPLSATAVEALCGHCQTQPPAFESCLSPFVYQAPLDHLLQRLKFNGRLEQARLLGELMAEWLAEVVEVPPDQLIPVPLHAARLRERGFNQAVELARPIARRFGLPLNVHGVRRNLATSPQSDLSRKQRLKNIRGAFEVVQPVSGHVVIIDDVMTTGSTADELARTLLRAGAERVEVWVCARA
jgi:ComF family protein